MPKHLKRNVGGCRAGNSIQAVNCCAFIKRFALLALIAVAACTNAGTSFAQVQYVRICNYGTLGAGYFYIPGTDTCAYSRNLPYTYSTAFGQFSTQPGTQATAYGTNAFANGTGSVAIGDHAFSGGDPFSASPGQSGSGIDQQIPNSAFSNANTTAVGMGARAGATAAGQDNATAVGNGALANAANASAFGQGAQANAANSVAIGQGSLASAPNTVSFGSAGNERRLTNVAAGINPTDAVNVGQLQSVAAGFQLEARRGIVAAVAVAPVLMPSAAGKTTIAVNSGFYRGETGIGIGISHRLNFSLPTVIYGSYSNGGGSEHIGRAGMAVEF
jgi:hypothetical protein